MRTRPVGILKTLQTPSNNLLFLDILKVTDSIYLAHIILHYLQFPRIFLDRLVCHEMFWYWILYAIHNSQVTIHLPNPCFKWIIILDVMLCHLHETLLLFNYYYHLPTCFLHKLSTNRVWNLAVPSKLFVLHIHTPFCIIMY